MKASDLDHQVTVEYKTAIQDPDYGTDDITWAPLTTTGSPPVAERYWAGVVDIPPSRSESVKMGLEIARNQTRIRMRYRNDIDSSMRITVHGDTDVVYQIVAGPAQVQGRKQLIEMVCEKYSS